MPTDKNHEEPLNARKKLIKVKLINPAHKNAKAWFASFTKTFESDLNYASNTIENAESFINETYKKIFDEEYMQPRPLRDVNKPLTELIHDVDLYYLQSVPEFEQLVDFIDSQDGADIRAQLTKNLTIAMKLNYLKLVQQELETTKLQGVKTNIFPFAKKKKEKTHKETVDYTNLYWKDVMRSEKLANEVLQLLTKEKFIKRSEGKYEWVYLMDNKKEVKVALTFILKQRNYFKDIKDTPIIHATKNQLNLSISNSYFTKSYREKALESYSRLFFFIPLAQL